MKMKDWFNHADRCNSDVFCFLALSFLLFLVIGCRGPSSPPEDAPGSDPKPCWGLQKGRISTCWFLAGAGGIDSFCSCSTIPPMHTVALVCQSRFWANPDLPICLAAAQPDFIVGLMWATFGWKVTMLYA